MKAATISRLVEALASDDGELESSFVNVFLTTYRAFADPEKVRINTMQRMLYVILSILIHYNMLSIIYIAGPKFIIAKI